MQSSRLAKPGKSFCRVHLCGEDDFSIPFIGKSTQAYPHELSRQNALLELGSQLTHMHFLTSRLLLTKKVNLKLQ